MLVVVPLLDPFTSGATGRALRTGLFQGIGILLLLVLLARVEFRGSLSRFLCLARSGVNTPVAVFLLWAALRALWAPDRAFAVDELLRLGCAALVYFAVVLHLETRAQLCLLIDCLLGMVILLIGCGLLSHASEAAPRFASVFPNPLLLSAILTVLFPLLASLALGMQDQGRRMAAIAAAILCAAGLLLALERSAWIATGVGLLVWLFLANKSAPHPERNWPATLVIAACGLLVGTGFFVVTGVGAVVAHRAQEISAAARGRDSSFAWRVQKWQGTVAMVARRPIWGWGTGQYVLQQLAYTHTGSHHGNRIHTQRELLRRSGASFTDMAHNDYLQTAAELGVPGLSLYLLLLASFFSKSIRALHRLPGGIRRTTLLGCISGVAAQTVDAMSNPAWRYSECSVFFWLVLGLGMAVTRMAYQTPGREPALAAVDPDENARVSPMARVFEAGSAHGRSSS
jgi:O-antigen ligase